MNIKGSVALVTGANRGLGRAFAQELLALGASKVYATARRSETIDIDGVVPVRLDITDPESIEAARAIAHDATLIINNAGIATGQNLVFGDLDLIRLEMETHYYGTLGVVRSFAPQLVASGEGAIINVISMLSWMPYLNSGAYAASKAAAWSLTENIRLELADKNVQVTALHMAATDTDMMAGIDMPKNDPRDVARLALVAMARNIDEVIADEATAEAKRLLGAAHHRTILAPAAASPSTSATESI